MPVLKAFFLPHPPLAVPGVGEGRENEIKHTIESFRRAASEIAAIEPETIIVMTPHGMVYSDYFHISPGDKASGSFAVFGAPKTVVSVRYDRALTDLIAHAASKLGIPAGTLGEKDPKLDHGTMVPLWFINQVYFNFKVVRISQSAMEAAAHYRMGQAISKAVKNTRTVFIASGDLSHKLAEDGPYGLAPEGILFDEAMIKIFKNGDFLSLLNIDAGFREKAAECGYNSFVTLAGIYDGLNVKSSLLSYENTFGVGYAAAVTEPVKKDTSRDILKQFEKSEAEKIGVIRQNEDAYQALARRSLEFTVKNGGTLAVPDLLPPEMLNTKAGTFVSIHKHGKLRGCIGTILPTEKNIAREIIKNAVSAALHDSRFEPVARHELPFLTYKVDVLSKPEPIKDASLLDVKKYGVIVSSGKNRGLLLPNLDGVETVEQQIDIAKQKAGITYSADVKLERFEVIRYE